MRTVDDVIRCLPARHGVPLSQPVYDRTGGSDRLMLAVASMASHSTDEGAQAQNGLAYAGYSLWGGGYPNSITDVREVLRRTDAGTVILQCPREWTGRTAGPGFDQRERFTNIDALAERPGIFRLAYVKDAQGDGPLHIQTAREAGVHAWVVYYHPRIIKHLAPFVRPEHLVRCRHTVDADLVPPYRENGITGREGCLLSGAVSPAYPLRQRLRANVGALYRTSVLAHPGYGRNVCHTPQYLKTLSRCRVAICTSSVYGFSLRKLVEATACGCAVVTDLPADDVWPGIDGNFTRVHPSITLREMSGLLKRLHDGYDPQRQAHFAAVAQTLFDYRAEGRRLAAAIEDLRLRYDAC